VKTFVKLICFSADGEQSSIDVIKETQTPKVGGLDIQFENGTPESEVKNILENYNMTVNDTRDYDSDYIRSYAVGS
jgi:hypothetical protein